MKRFVTSIILTLCISTLLCGMGQPALPPLNPLQIKNAQGFGKLPQKVLLNIASYCSPQDRYAMRRTCTLLKQQLEGQNYPKTWADEENKLVQIYIDQRINIYPKIEMLKKSIDRILTIKTDV